MSTTASTTKVERAVGALAGRVVLRDHPNWDEARLAWNLAVDQQPAAIVFPESADDVIAAVELARAFELRVTAQGTGHSAAPLGPLEDTLLVKTERMRGIEIDPDTRIARIDAGVRSLELVEAAARDGLAPLAGSSPDIGVVGYTLGGGLSWFGRKYGLAASNVHAIELVTADGRLVRAEREQEPDLFWALRGGGGSFGIVTALELRLVPVSEVYAGILWWPIERDQEVLHAWAELTRKELPDELTTVGRYLRLPPLPDIPAPMRGKSFVAVEVIHLGEPQQADDLLAPIRALDPAMDTIRRIPTLALSHMHMDPEQPAPAAGEGMLLAKLSPEAIDEIIRTAGAASTAPFVSLEVRQLGGELGRARPENGALAAVDAEYVLYAVGIAPTPEASAHVRAHLELVFDAVGPWGATQTCFNFTDTRRDPHTLWSESAHPRLRRIKATVDPDNLIRSNQPVSGEADRELDFRPVMGERWEIIESTEDTSGELFESTLWLDPHMPGPPPHLHPNTEESFEVLEGSFDVFKDGGWTTLRPRESATVPANVRHTFRNARDETAKVVIRVRPAGRSEAFFRHMHKLIAEGKLKQLPPKKPGSAIYAAMLLGEYRDWTRPTGPLSAVLKTLAFTGKALRFKI